MPSDRDISRTGRILTQAFGELAIMEAMTRQFECLAEGDTDGANVMARVACAIMINSPLPGIVAGSAYPTYAGR